MFSQSSSSIVAVRSSQDLFSMPEAPPSQAAQLPPPPKDNAVQSVEHIVCHVDFDKLHAAACRLDQLQKQSAKKRVQHRQTDPSQIVHAVLHLAREKENQDDSCSVVIPRKVFCDIDSMIDECIVILNKESDWFMKSQQQESLKSSSVTRTSTTSPPTPQVIAKDTCEKDEWEELLEIVSGSFDGASGLDASLMDMTDDSLPPQHTTGGDPLLMFADYWSGHDVDSDCTPMDTYMATPDCNDDAISIVTVSSTQTEQDPLDLFPEFWGIEDDAMMVDFELEPLSI